MNRTFSWLLVAMASSALTYSLTRWDSLTDTGPVPDPAREMQAQVRQNAEQLQTFTRELALLRKQLSTARSTANAWPESNPKPGERAVSDRLEKLENAYELLRNTHRGEGLSPSQSAVKGALRDVASAGSSEPGSAGEAIYEADVGQPLEQVQGAISQAFVALGANLELQDLSCRETVCKVTYRELEVLAEDSDQVLDEEFLLLGRISESLGGAQLDIHAAIDEFGNSVMYLQTR